MLNVTPSTGDSCWSCEYTGPVRQIMFSSDGVDTAVDICPACAKRLIVQLRSLLVGPAHLHAPVSLTPVHAEFQRAQIEAIVAVTTMPVESLSKRVREAMHRVTEAGANFISNFGRADAWL